MVSVKLIEALSAYSSARTVRKKEWKKAGDPSKDFSSSGYIKAMNAQEKTGKAFKKASVISGMKIFSKILSSVATVGMMPAAMTFSETFGKISEVFAAILSPLEPFLELLSMFATMIEIALTPLTVELWDEFSSVMNDLSEAMPALMEQIQEWIGDNDGLQRVINIVRQGMDALIVAMEEGLIEDIAKLAVNMLLLASMLVKADEDGNTLIGSIVKLAVAFSDLLVSLEPLFPLINNIVDAATGLTQSVTGTGDAGRSLPWATIGGAAAGPAGMAIGAVSGLIGDLFGMQSGGITKGPMQAQLHPNELVVDLNSPEADRILPDNEAMIREQQLTNELLAEFININRRHPVRR